MNSIIKYIKTKQSITLYFLLAQITLFLIGIIKIPLYTRLFLPGEIGMYSWSVAFLSYIDIIFLSWVNATLWRFIYTEKKTKFFFSLLTNILPLFIVIALISFSVTLVLLSLITLPPQIKTLISVGFFSILSQQVLSFVLFYFHAYKQFKKWSLVIIIQQIFTLLLFLICYYYFKLGLLGIFYSTIILNTAIILFYSLKHFNLLKVLITELRTTYAKDYFKYSYLSIILSLCLMILNNSDRFFIYYLKNETDLGLYSQYYGLASVGFFSAIQAFNSYFGPSYNLALTKPNAYYINLSVIKLYLLLFTPLAIFSLINNEVLINFLFAEKYHGYNSVFNWALIGLYFFGFYNLLEVRMKFLNQIKTVIVALTLVVLLNIIANYFFLTIFDFRIASIISFFCYLILLLYSIVKNYSFISKIKLKNAIINLTIASCLYYILQLLLFQNVEFSSPFIYLTINFILAFFIYYFTLSKHVFELVNSIEKDN